MPDYEKVNWRQRLADEAAVQQQLKAFKQLQTEQALAAQKTAEFNKIQDYLGQQLKAGSITAEQYSTKMRTLSTFTDSATTGSSRLAKTLHVTDMSFQGVGEAIANAVLKVSLWIAATTVVLGTTRKLQEVVELWRDLEVTLERIGITTSAIGEDLYRYFDLTADVAIRMGMPIEQTLEGMDLALRATASYEDQAQRTTTAQLMLRDAAILGNVAGMEFSSAIDILVGSLRQTGMELDQGVVLLDKWVAVAKNAAVSVNDLSQGFAIMSSAAASAGLNVDQVNGIITALSEAVTLGPTEVGNAVRALMSTLYNEGSINTLNRYGVAVRDATGEFRSFWEIMNQLSSMTVTGALSEDQILEIAKAAGAGQRRYAQFIALLKNWSNAVRAADVSANAYGEALDANERIVNTLTNAWDQFTAAQNKFWYAMGDRGGMIEDLTESFQGLASVFSWFADLNEPLARTVKIAAELTVALTALKIASIGLSKVGIASWAAVQFQSLGRLRALVGAGGAAAAVSPVAGTTLTQAGRIQVPAGGLPGTTYKGGQLIGAVPAGYGAVGRLDTARAAWSGVGRTLTTPMRGFWLAGGALAGGAIAKELYDAPWSDWGGGIGAAVGGYLGGPAGMAVGALIGGGIATIINQASMTAEERIDRAREKIIEDMPDDLADALSKAQTQFNLADTLIIPLENLIREQKLDYEAEAKTYKEQAERIKNYVDGLEETMEVGRQVGSAEMVQGASIARWWASLFEEPKAAGFEQTATGLEEAAKNVLLAEQKVLTVDDEIALRSKEIRDELDLQASAEAKVEEVKRRTLELTSDERDEMISLARSASLTYANFQTMLERYADELPGLAEKFKSMFPSYEAFAALDPESYAPLNEALTTLVTNEQKLRDYASDVEGATRLLSEDLGGVNPTLENVTNQYEYWAKLQDAVNKGAAKLTDYYEAFNVETEEEAVAALSNILSLLGSAKDAIQDMTTVQNEYNNAVDVVAERLDYVSNYIKPGQLAFFDVDQEGLSRMGALIEKYEDMLGAYIDSERQVYHAFAKTEEGAVQNLLGTFETYPEIWSAMLAELQGIEDNTSKMIEAEYNLPGWYERPSRYWAMKTVQPTTFGPVQESLWQMWEEFLANRSMQSGGEVHDTGPYFLHRKEVVVSGDTLAGTNSVLNNSYRVLATSQQYLSNISQGILSLRQEIQQLRRDMAQKNTASGDTEFGRTTRAGYLGVSSLGVRR